VLLAFAAGWVSGALPRWFVVVGVLFLVVFLALPPDLPRPLAAVLYLLEVTLLAGLCWFGLRAARDMTGVMARR
jgi:hypothetical protein